MTTTSFRRTNRCRLNGRMAEFYACFRFYRGIGNKTCKQREDERKIKAIKSASPQNNMLHSPPIIVNKL